MFEILGQIDRGHAPLPQLPLDAVAVGKGSRELLLDGQWSIVMDRRSWIVERSSYRGSSSVCQLRITRISLGISWRMNTNRVPSGLTS
jgi:hypothetical protein